MAREVTERTREMSFQAVFQEAQSAAEKAFRDAKPNPVAFQNSGLGESFDWSKPYSVVSEGVCGFAWVNVYVDGRSKIAKEMKQFGLQSDYCGGYNFWSSDACPSSRSSQSMERKEAACEAFAEVLRKYGFRAYMSSRMD